MIGHPCGGADLQDGIHNGVLSVKLAILRSAIDDTERPSRGST